MKQIGIFGTSGFARETADVAIALGYTPVFIAKDQAEAESWSFDDAIILEAEIDRLKNLDFALGIGENRVRERLFRKYETSLRFVNLIHPSASFGARQRERMARKQGVIVCAGVRFTNNIEVGHCTIVNLNVTIGHDGIIEDFVNISPGASISGNVHLQASCWIGTGAVINQGENDCKLIIGAGTVIGSGSVVVKHCEPNAVYVGIPAKRIK